MSISRGLLPCFIIMSYLTFSEEVDAGATVSHVQKIINPGKFTMVHIYSESNDLQFTINFGDKQLFGPPQYFYQFQGNAKINCTYYMLNNDYIKITVTNTNAETAYRYAIAIRNEHITKIESDKVYL